MPIRDLIPWKIQGHDIVSRQEERVDHPVVSLRRDINHLFDEMFRGFSMPSLPSIGRSLGWPRVELSENDKEVRVTAELPGMEEKDIEISLDDHLLVIRGERSPKLATKNGATRNSAMADSNAVSACPRRLTRTRSKPLSETAF